MHVVNILLVLDAKLENLETYIDGLIFFLIVLDMLEMISVRLLNMNRYTE